MKKAILAALVAALLFVGGQPEAQDSQYQTKVLSGTADVIIDSSLTASLMDWRRLYINGIYWWYDNAVNTNQMFVEIVRGQTAMATAGLRRQFKYSEAMTSSGIKGTAFVPNITTGADSTIYFVIQATASDSLYLAINYKLVN